MARNLSSDFITEITKYGQNSCAPVMLLKGYFDSGVLGLWNGIGTLSYGGIDYEGAAPILGLDQVKEQKTLAASGINVTLSGLDATILDLAMNEPYQGRLFEMYIAMIDNTGAVISSPYLMFRGYMDVMKISDDAKNVQITIAVESELIALERALNSKYTPEDQHREFPNDTGFDYVADLQNQPVLWG